MTRTLGAGPEAEGKEEERGVWMRGAGAGGALSTVRAVKEIQFIFTKLDQ